MPPEEITFVQDAPFVLVTITLPRRKFDRINYRPRHWRKVGILKYWLVCRKKRYFKIRKWIFSDRVLKEFYGEPGADRLQVIYNREVRYGRNR
jgi:hypothetical protein